MAQCSRTRSATCAGSGGFHLEAGGAVGALRAADRGRTDWSAIFELYYGLLELTNSPVVAVSCAVALGETAGPHRNRRNSTNSREAAQ